MCFLDGNAPRDRAEEMEQGRWGSEQVRDTGASEQTPTGMKQSGCGQQAELRGRCLSTPQWGPGQRSGAALSPYT